MHVFSFIGIYSSSVSSSTLKAPNLSIWAMWGAKEWQSCMILLGTRKAFFFSSLFFFFLQHQKGVALELIRYCNIIHNKTDRTKVNGRKWVIRETAAIPIKIIKLWHCMFFTAGHRLAVKEISILSNVENAECIGVDYRVLI